MRREDLRRRQSGALRSKAECLRFGELLVGCMRGYQTRCRYRSDIWRRGSNILLANAATRREHSALNNLLGTRAPSL